MVINNSKIGTNYLTKDLKVLADPTMPIIIKNKIMMNPLDVFKEEAPEVQKAYAGVINSLIALKALDNKTKQLVYIGMKIATDDINAVKYHVPMAKIAGASRDEVKEVILLSLTVNGLKGISKFLPEALEIFDNN